MHGNTDAEDEPMSSMNFIPLIDIALTLVIILMVTTAFVRPPGVSLKLPETATREGAPETSKDLVVSVDAAGEIYVDAVRITAAACQAKLNAVAGRNRDARVLVKGDRDVPYRKVMDVMDMARQAGLTRISLITDPKPAGLSRS